MYEKCSINKVDLIWFNLVPQHGIVHHGGCHCWWKHTCRLMGDMTEGKYILNWRLVWWLWHCPGTRSADALPTKELLCWGQNPLGHTEVVCRPVQQMRTEGYLWVQFAGLTLPTGTCPPSWTDETTCTAHKPVGGPQWWGGVWNSGMGAGVYVKDVVSLGHGELCCWALVWRCTLACWQSMQEPVQALTDFLRPSQTN